MQSIEWPHVRSIVPRSEVPAEVVAASVERLEAQSEEQVRRMAQEMGRLAVETPLTEAIV